MRQQPVQASADQHHDSADENVNGVGTEDLHFCSRRTQKQMERRQYEFERAAR